MREFFFRLHPDIVALSVKGPLWTGLGLFIVFRNTPTWPYMIAGMLVISGVFTSLWVSVIGLYLIKLCPDKYGLSTRRFVATIWLHWLAALGILYWLIVIITFQTPPFHVAGDLGRTAVIAYSVTFMLLWRTRMRGLVSLERKHAVEEEAYALKWWQWRFFPFGVKLVEVQNRIQAFRHARERTNKKRIKVR